MLLHDIYYSLIRVLWDILTFRGPKSTRTQKKISNLFVEWRYFYFLNNILD